MTDVWHVFTADEPIRCPNRLPDGRICNRAQDRAAPETTVRVRLQPHPRNAAPGSLLRICRACDGRLEVNVAPTTVQHEGDARVQANFLAVLQERKV